MINLVPQRLPEIKQDISFQKEGLLIKFRLRLKQPQNLAQIITVRIENSMDTYHIFSEFLQC